VAYHIVRCPKYRRNLPEAVQATVRTTIQAVAQARRWEVKEMQILPDHIHLFLSAPPTESPTGIVKVLKDITGQTLFANHPELREMFRHGHIWSPSYYVGTVGHVSEETVARYVRDQKLRTVGRPSKARLASSPQQVERSPLTEDL
jgi:putative transposase